MSGPKNTIVAAIGITVMVLGGMVFPVKALTKDRGTATPTVVIEYGSKLEDVDFVADDMKSLGISVELKTGYTNPSCGRVTVNGKSVEFDQDSVDGG
tara:strand:+ start:33 stop:323 length:291 start_codon:yes stop_codon:yes gene_type:complete